MTHTRPEAVDTPDELPNSSSSNPPWVYPNCPQCERHIYVSTSLKDGKDWLCFQCECHWNVVRRA